MKNKLTKRLIKIDLAVYILASIGLLYLGIFMITTETEISRAKNMAMGMQILGVFVLLIGITTGVLTFIKIRDTKF
ncbi:hypothetical protein ULMS_14800 [Patiriisocius marinistellae]|uniref:Uncharacterized protein n=1 Tax=Patiriisocius marinistellae TaxID=2494560 RepID=A0A5J4FXR6_9FLAO|nr:hypothetical protein [Patiriisocius marinistellae]GEQ85972.1 hypothetical protein ULMS_14800 [Patiriisocius marinistellae]